MSESATRLRAGLDEDEAALSIGHCGCLDANHWPSCVPTPGRDRAVREVEAKRKILALCESETDETAGKPVAIRVMALLAGVYDAPGGGEQQ